MDSDTFYRLSEQAKSKVISKTLTTYYENKALYGGIGQFVDTTQLELDFPHLFKELQIIDEQNPNIGKKDTIAYLVTFSPDPALELDYFTLRDIGAKTWKKKAGIEYIIWNIEQSGRTEEEIGYHPHMHALIIIDKTNQSSQHARITKWIKDKFQDYKTTSNHYLQIDQVNSSKLMEKLNYIKGIKIKSKMPLVKMDQLWRRTISPEDSDYFDVGYCTLLGSQHDFHSREAHYPEQ